MKGLLPAATSFARLAWELGLGESLRSFLHLSRHHAIIQAPALDMKGDLLLVVDLLQSRWYLICSSCIRCHTHLPAWDHVDHGDQMPGILGSLLVYEHV